jgi:hypothetical protein
MTPFEAIKALRDTGVVRGGVATFDGGSVAAVAAYFGLKTTPDTFSEITRRLAHDILANVVHRDLAHGGEFTSRTEAERLAADFLAQVTGSGTRFFTNGTIGWTEEPPSPGRTWMPATSATFDTGVLVAGHTLVACLWVEDED